MTLEQTKATDPKTMIPQRLGKGVRYAGRCTGCRKWITAQTRRQWQRAVKEPCPHCGRRGW